MNRKENIFSKHFLHHPVITLSVLHRLRSWYDPLVYQNNYRQVRGLAGATVLGDGSVAMIIDVYDISRDHLGQKKTNALMSFELAEKPLPLH